MKDLFSQFRDQSESIRIPPHRRSWDRIESRLSAHQSKRKLVHTRVFSFAAVLLCLIAISGGILVYTYSQHPFDSDQFSQNLEELKATATSAESIYDTDRIRIYYSAAYGQ